MKLANALSAAVDVAAADPDVRVIVIEGAGPAFSSGYDLTDEAGGEGPRPVRWRQMVAVDVAATLLILDCPKPLIAQIHGYALAAVWTWLWAAISSPPRRARSSASRRSATDRRR